jgi:pyruvyl transferase EpsO
MKYHNLFKKHLRELDPIDKCIIFNWPNYANNGDHFLALGTLLYLIEEHKTEIVSITDSMKPNKETCVIVGGGNFGDLWPNVHNKVRSYVKSHQNNRIVIFPVSIYFENKDYLEESRKIFNDAKDVTLMCREHASFMLASKYFDKCKIILVPDAAFYLEPLIHQYSSNKSTLFLSRNDKELLPKDYFTYSIKTDWAHSVFNLAQTLPKEAVVSLSVLLGSTLQVKKFNKVITNRLHAHILCVMLGIVTTLISNTYHKNESFYKTWTYPDLNTDFIK